MQPTFPQVANTGLPPVMSPEFIRRAVRTPAAADPDRATAQTIEIMCGHIARASADPVLQAAARTALAQYANGGPVWATRGIDPFTQDDVTRSQAIAEACWWYAKHHVRFVHHQKQLVAWFGESHHLQLLTSPDVLLRFPFPMEGDCAIFSMLICAMLQALGQQWELVTVAWDPDRPDIFLHVYPRAVLADGSRLALDASHGKYPGWSIPMSQRLRVAVWNESGAAVPDAGEQRFTGLNGYGFLGARTSNGFGHYLRGRGFGQTDDTGGDSSTTDMSSAPLSYPVTVTPPVIPPASTDTSMVNPYAALVGSYATAGYSTGTDPGTGLSTATVPASASAPAQTGFVAPSQSSAQWAAFATAMGKAGMTLAEITAIQPGTLVAPNGAIMRQAAGFPITGNPLAAFGSSLSTAIASPTSASGLLWIGGGILALVVVASMFGGKR